MNKKKWRNDIVLDPEIQKLKLKITDLKEDIVSYVEEKDELIFSMCPSLENLHVMLIGVHMFRAYEASCELNRIRRKIALVLTALNQGKSPDLKKIEKILDTEFAEFLKHIAMQQAKLQAALEWSDMPTLSEAETKEFKELYRSLVKKLHPDLHPKQDKKELNLFLKVVTAYENGDLLTLRLIAVGVDFDETEEGKIFTSKSILLKEIERLETLLSETKRQIEEIKNRFPYNQKGLLEDDKQINEEVAKFKKAEEKIQANIEEYSQRLEMLINLHSKEA